MNNFITRLITSVILLASFFLIFFYMPPISISMILLAALVYILIFEWPQLCKPKKLWFLTPFYPVLPFLILIKIPHCTLFRLIILVVTFDSASYLAGKLFGKHTIAPSISPGKTWEGFMGGFIAAILTAHFFVFAQPITKNYLLHLFIFVIGLCIAALCGDLFESYLKRRVGIKDSGSLLPGHGGLLDRVDGLLFAGLYIIARLLIIIVAEIISEL